MNIEPFRLERYFAEYEFGDALLLGSSDCESISTAELLALEPGAHEALLAQRLGYTESLGAPELRGAIAGLYERVTADDVLVHAGAEEAVYAFMRAVLRPGDRVVVQVPCYQSLEDVARAHGCDVLSWRPSAEGPPWEWDVATLARLCSDGARAIVVNAPHNPTGFLPGLDMLRAIVALADQHGAVLFCDEVYRFLEFDAPRLPAACDLSPNAVSLGTVSKSFGLPGLRIGWLASRSPELLHAVAGYKDYLTICSSAPSELLAAVALRRRDAILARVRTLLAANRALLAAFFREQAPAIVGEVPAAGPVAYARVAGSAAALCARAIEAGVMLVPSAVFGDGDSHVRVGFGRANLAAALARFAPVLAAGRSAGPAAGARRTP
jgi:aspartate/methionine/tyrosine aminotransferase